MKKMLTTAQAAKVKGWSSSTMLRALEDGQFRAFRTPGGHYRIDPDSLGEADRHSGIEDERGACARLAEGGPVKLPAKTPRKWIDLIRRAIADAIRARGPHK